MDHGYEYIALMSIGLLKIHLQLLGQEILVARGLDANVGRPNYRLVNLLSFDHW